MNVNSDTIDWFQKCVVAIRSGNEEQRKWGALCLGDISFEFALGDEEAPDELIDIWLAALSDRSGSVRETAALSIEGCEKELRLVPRLTDLAKDIAEPISVRAASVRGLALLRAANSVTDEVMTFLQCNDPSIRLLAADALYFCPPVALTTIERLYEALHDELTVVRVKVCWCVWELLADAEAILSVLIHALSDDEAVLDAARLLVRMKSAADTALPHLLALRTHEHKFVRLQAVRATMNLTCSDEQAEPVLMALADDPDEIVRSYVAQAREKRQNG